MVVPCKDLSEEVTHSCLNTFPKSARPLSNIDPYQAEILLDCIVPRRKICTEMYAFVC